MKKNQVLRRAASILMSAVIAGGIFGQGMPVFAAKTESSGTDGPYAVLEASLEAAGRQADYDGYIFKVKDSVSVKKIAALDNNIQAEDGIEPMGYTDLCYTAESLEDIENCVPEELLEYVEPNYKRYLTDVSLDSATEPNDKYYSTYQWNIGALGVDDIWKYGLEGQDIDESTDYNYNGIYDDDPIVVAVLDSGLKAGHEDIDFSHIISGKNIVNPASSSTDDTLGHGTFVTGIIMASKDNETGIAGIAQDVYVMPIKVFEQKEVDDSIIIDGIQYAVDQKKLFDSTKGASGTNVSVINMSLGGSGTSATMKTACEEAMEAGIIIVCAAGNDGNTAASYPAQYTMGIGATNSDGNVSDFSQRLSSSNGSGYENKVWVTAPGENITSCFCENTSSYTQADGTSFSSPEVAALAAIAKSINNQITHDQFKQLLKETAVKAESSSGNINGQDIQYGWGMVSFPALIDKILGEITGTSIVNTQVYNEAGTQLTGAVVKLYENLAENGQDIRGREISPEPDGTYILQKGQRYWYTAAASKYETQENSFVVLTSKRTLTITLLGQAYNSRFHITNSIGQDIAAASISVKAASGIAVPQQADGSFATRNGTYEYTVTAPGYFKTTGTFTIDDTKQDNLENGNIIDVTLYGDVDVCSQYIKVLDDNNEDISGYVQIELTNEAGGKEEPAVDGSYKLGQGSYQYTISADYYETLQGTLTIDASQINTYRQLAVNMEARTYSVYVDVFPLTVTNAVITVTDCYGAVQPSTNGKGEYRLKNGQYFYEVSAEGHNTYRGSFLVSGKKVYVDIQMEWGNGVITDGSKEQAGDSIVINNVLVSVSDLQGLQGQTAGDYAGVALTTLAESCFLPEKRIESICFKKGETTYSCNAADLADTVLAWEKNGTALGTFVLVKGKNPVMEAPECAEAVYHMHDYAGTVTSKVDCTADGEILWSCGCGEEYSAKIPAYGHQYVNGECTRCGEIEQETEFIYYQYSDAGNPDQFEEIGFRAMGKYRKTVTYHCYDYTGSEESHTCTGITMQDLIQNFLEESKCVESVVVESCYDGSYMQFKSSYFSKMMVAWEVDGESASGYEGDNGLRLVVDGDYNSAWLFSPAYLYFTTAENHSYQEVETKPTCTARGYTTHVCETCGRTYIDGYTEAAGHNYGTGETVDPTCTEGGYSKEVCQNCGNVHIFDYTDMLGHDYQPVVTGPTYEQNGYTTYTCSRCHESYRGDETEKLVLAQPVLINGTNVSGGIQLTWEKVSAASGYNIYRKEAGGSYKKIETVSGASTTSWTDTSAAAGKTFTYTVQAYQGNAVSSYDQKGISVVRLQVTKVTAVNTAKGLKISWAKATGAKTYTIYQKKGSGEWKTVKTINSANTLSWNTGALTNGAKYSYYVVAGSGSSSSVPSASATTYRVDPVKIKGLKNSKKKTLVLSYKKNAKATGFQIQYSTSKNFKKYKKKTVSGAKKTKVKLTGLNKKKYYVRIRAYKKVSGITCYSTWTVKNAKVSK